MQNTLQQLADSRDPRAHQVGQLHDVYEPTFSQESLEQEGNLSHLIFDDAWVKAHSTLYTDAVTQYFWRLNKSKLSSIGVC
jgi:hypothetical protein